MKKFIRQYAAFNVWANERISGAIDKLTDEQFNQPLKSSFPTIRETLIHVLQAQDIWLERFKGTSPTSWPEFTGTKDELIMGLLKSSKAVEEKAKGYNKKKLKEEVHYTTLKGISGESEIYQMLAHVINHGTYHRGQLVTMLRNVGVTEIPATDLIAFFRGSAAKK